MCLGNRAVCSFTNRFNKHFAWVMMNLVSNTVEPRDLPY